MLRVTGNNWKLLAVRCIFVLLNVYTCYTVCVLAVELAQQLLCTFGSDETEQQCEDSMCPQLLVEVGLDDIPLVSDPLCAVVCEE